MLWSGNDTINLRAVKIFAILFQYFDCDKLGLHKKMTGCSKQTKLTTTHHHRIFMGHLERE